MVRKSDTLNEGTKIGHKNSRENEMVKSIINAHTSISLYAILCCDGVTRRDKSQLTKSVVAQRSDTVTSIFPIVKQRGRNIRTYKSVRACVRVKGFKLKGELICQDQKEQIHNG